MLSKTANAVREQTSAAQGITPPPYKNEIFLFIFWHYLSILFVTFFSDSSGPVRVLVPSYRSPRHQSVTKTGVCICFTDLISLYETQLLVTIQDLLFHRDKHVPVRLSIWLYWIFLKLLMLFHTDWGSSAYGINGPILRWIEAFLTDRVQGVVVEGFRSPEGMVLSGVPQGTVLCWDPFCFCFT